MAFRTDPDNRLIAFIGNSCKGITVDGRKYAFAEQPLAKIVFIPEITEQGTVYQIQIQGTGRVSLPIVTGKKVPVVRTGEQIIPSKVNGQLLLLDIDASLSGKWLSATL